MEESEETLRPAKRTKEAASSTTTTVALESDAYSMLKKTAKKLNVRYSAYASAAIRYFASNGLDPTSQQTMGLISVQAKVGEASLDVRKAVTETGNHTRRTIRAFEHEMFKFLQAQQAGTFAYLERVEATLLQNQADMELRILTQLLERFVKNEVEGQLNRVLLEKLLLKTKEQNFSEAELEAAMESFVSQRKHLLLTEYRKLLSTLTAEKPHLTTRPALAVVPSSAPMKPNPAETTSPPAPSS
ncbi:hypothetical protein [Hymenobacter psoromatis]|uniref:hypothetical protein n=1 Tax=Hymenobacter psoromatis TaxID=1484116 RepID=UPI001CC0CB02|nr:hypothetical protein [Hymenobacter psoromatis]